MNLNTNLIESKLPVSLVTNEDCMEMMKRYPDKFFDLAIVDPPYGLGSKLTNGGGNHLKFKNDKTIERWDVIPDESYFEELFRVSKNQIIWGGNYFNLPSYRCAVVWDKLQAVDNFSQMELAWTSFDKPAKIFKERQAGFIGEDKIHPTQKPVKLYKWCLKQFATYGCRILDTHLGSGSHRIAAFSMGFDFYATEISEKYFMDQEKRFREQTAQQSLFGFNKAS